MTSASRLTNYEKVQVTELSCFIDSHLHLKLDAKMLMGKSGLNRKKLNTGFKSFYRMGWQQYILTCRMRTAMFMLRNSNKLIKQIAGEVGYKDVTAFTRAFRRFYGKAPVDFR